VNHPGGTAGVDPWAAPLDVDDGVLGVAAPLLVLQPSSLEVVPQPASADAAGADVPEPQSVDAGSGAGEVLQLSDVPLSELDESLPQLDSLDEGVGSGAAPQPAGSDAVVDAAAVELQSLAVVASASAVAGTSSVTGDGSDTISEVSAASEPAEAVRVKNATTSLPADRIVTTSQPSADRSVSLALSVPASNDETLMESNSCMRSTLQRAPISRSLCAVITGFPVITAPFCLVGLAHRLALVDHRPTKSSTLAPSGTPS
jgi:hypothetical protein